MNAAAEKTDVHALQELEAENARLAAENEQLRREREILKRTLGIIAEQADGEFGDLAGV
ncbi:MAG: hypothetical protein ACREFX_03510 [Opitutaceae bacterium]